MLNRRIITSCLVSVFIFATASVASAHPTQVPGLHSAAKVIRDLDGIPHIIANNEHDLIFMQGYVHGQDRFFQMDVLRRQASGTLAELLGAPALGSDVELRTLGLRRAATLSLVALSVETQTALEAYAEGMNFFLATHPLPPEYTPLEISAAEPWSALDSVVMAKLLAFGLSFDLDIGFTEALLSYQIAGGILGFDGAALFSEDLFRTAPFDPAATIPDASIPAPHSHGKHFWAAPAGHQGQGKLVSAAASGSIAQSAAPMHSGSTNALHPATMGLAREYMERAKHIPILKNALEPRNRPRGSNEWAVSGKRTRSGRPLIANDPHLTLNTPSTFYQNHLVSRHSGLDVFGSSFAGVPYVVLGQNKHIAWGATVNPMDVTDTFQEQVVPDGSSPSGLSTLYLGNPEPIIPIPELFRYNVIGDAIADNLNTAPPGGTVNGTFIPPATLIVPRRNNGPIITIDLTTGFALSVQYTGFGPTREADTFRAWNHARNLQDFIKGMQFFDFGSQNWAYVDVKGNIAYFTSAELPIREDLQANTIVGLPPHFIRSGLGGNEWLPVTNPQPHQATPFEILPFDEMPKIINPPARYFVNANNDPTGNTRDNNAFNEFRPGGGIFYLNPGYAVGMRAGRITQDLGDRLAAGRVTLDDMQAIQANVRLLDAEVFTPFILDAFGNAGTHPLLGLIASDPRVAEAVARLSQWDFSTPTGVDEGYDSSDVDGTRFAPTAEEIANSIAATLYSVWRGQMIGNTIDVVLDAIGLPKPGSSQTITALRNLLDNYDTNLGVGASGLNFFNVPGVTDPFARRDILILKSLQDALDLLAGAAFNEAFAGSVSQDDYRWGRLHRIVLDHPLGGPFNTPPAGGAFPGSFPDLDGFAVDGGFGAVDASSHSARAASSNAFMYGSGPARRYAGEAWRHGHGIKGRTTLPGGPSGVLGSPFYTNILGRWLTNDTYDVRQRMSDLRHHSLSREVFVPAHKKK